MDNQAEELIIIGSGPAGLTAAIYASRGNLKPLVVAGRQPGGQLTLTTEIEDYPGFEDGIDGSSLMDKMRKQAERFDTRFIPEDVLSVDLNKYPFEVKTETKVLRTIALIVATGATASWLGLESEKRFKGKGVSACAVCDGFFFKGKTVAVVGGGDTAMREANYLSKIAERVLIIHRREKLRAQTALQELVKQKANIEFLWNAEVIEVLGEDKVTGLQVKNTQSEKTYNIDVDGLFVAIGHEPNTGFLRSQVKLDKKGYIEVSHKTHTSVPGVFAAGDVADYKYRQAVTAASAGCQAAFDAEEYLEGVKLPTEGNGG